MEEKDRCVVCYTETPYMKNTPIEEREFYIEGCGQLCESCYQEIKAEELADKKLRFI